VHLSGFCSALEELPNLGAAAAKVRFVRFEDICAACNERLPYNSIAISRAPTQPNRNDAHESGSEWPLGFSKITQFVTQSFSDHIIMQLIQ